MSLKESSIILNIDGQHLSIPEIHQRFQQCPAGERLGKKQVRWSCFQPKDISQKMWRSPILIGLDANNLEHAQVTVRETIAFIEAQNNSDSPIKFNVEEQHIMVFLAETHDWPEGITKKGDIPGPDKTDEDEQKELEVIEGAITHIIGNGPQAQKLALDVRFYLSPEGKKTKIGEAFNVIEKIGYFQTAIRSWQKSFPFGQSNSELYTQCQLLTCDVLINNFPNLLENSDKYPRVKTVLHNQKHWIDQAFAIKQSTINKHHKQDKIDELKAKFIKSKNDWQKWCKINPIKTNLQDALI
jgi:hypothetical protein